MAKKQALTFNLEPEADASVPLRAGAHEPKAPAKAPVRLKQVGARIPEPLYRELKAHAALKGEPVQTVVEVLISDYLRQQRGG